MKELESWRRAAVYLLKETQESDILVLLPETLVNRVGSLTGPYPAAEELILTTDDREMEKAGLRRETMAIEVEEEGKEVT